MSSSIIDFLSDEILANSVLPFVATPHEIRRCGRVCRTFHKAAQSTSLWEMAATIRYGNDIVQYITNTTTQQDTFFPSIYRDWKHAMLQDDNAGVAHPTLRQPRMWTMDIGSFVAIDQEETDCYCMIQGIKWYRQKGVVSIYLTVQGGDPELPSPRSSVIIASSCTGTRSGMKSAKKTTHKTSRPLSLTRRRQNTRPFLHHGRKLFGAINAEISCPQPGHYKGRLDFAETIFFQQNKSFSFQYAGLNSFHYAGTAYDNDTPDNASRSDYHCPVQLFTIGPDESLEHVFGLDQVKPCFSIDVNPYFEVLTTEQERQQWEAMLPLVDAASANEIFI